MKKLTYTILAIALITISCAKKDTTLEEHAAADTTTTAADNNSTIAERDTVANTTSGSESAANSAATTKHNGNELTVKGTVTGIMPGKDGYTAKLKAEDGKMYMAIISIPNMEKEYKQVKQGETVTVTGEAYTIEEDITIKVKKIQLMP